MTYESSQYFNMTHVGAYLTLTLTVFSATFRMKKQFNNKKIAVLYIGYSFLYPNIENKILI